MSSWRAEALAKPAADDAGAYPPRDAFLGISVERLKREGPLRLNLPENYTPFAEGNFGTPSGKCEFYSETMAKHGLDPLPTYTPPHEDPQTRPDLAGRFPLQLLSPAVAVLSEFDASSTSSRCAAGRRADVADSPQRRRPAQHRRRPNGARLQRARRFSSQSPRGDERPARRGRLARRLVEPLHPRRRQLQHHDQRGSNRSRRRRHVFR